MAADDEARKSIQSEPTIFGGFRQISTSFRKQAVIFCLLVLVALMCAAAAFALNVKGYCYSDRKFISTQEMFDASIAAVLAQTHTTIRYQEPQKTTYKAVELVRYPDREHFLKTNSNCCAVLPFNTGDAAPYVTLSQRISGYAAGLVKIEYSATYLDEHKAEKKTSLVAYYVVTNCGRIWNAQH